MKATRSTIGNFFKWFCDVPDIMASKEYVAREADFYLADTCDFNLEQFIIEHWDERAYIIECSKAKDNGEHEIAVATEERIIRLDCGAFYSPFD